MNSSCSSHHSAGQYRADIEGLRAVAVLSIVLFHFGFSFVPGGFVGVDIFFVISGFLISRIIYSEVDGKSFSLVDFYSRRARRILPALFVTLGVASIPAFFLLYPVERIDFAKSAIASALFSANLYFYSTLNYFSARAEDTPLLHLWSLGVEEQFYLLFPVLCLLLARMRPKAMPTAIVAALAVSLVASTWMLGVSPTASFYLLPFRAFELLIGSTLALPGLQPMEDRRKSLVAFFAGLACILAAILFFDRYTSFPGPAALLPCLGAALIIYAGSTQDALSRKTLGMGPLPLVGRISYSLYLVHWPLLVFASRAWPDAKEPWFSLGLLASSLGLAFVSYRFVEQPFRKPKSPGRPRRVFGLSIAAMGAVISVAGLVIHQSGFQGGLNDRIDRTVAYLKYDSSRLWRVGQCFLEDYHVPSGMDFTPCLPQGEGPRVLIWGDSFAAQYYPGLKTVLTGKGYAVGALTASQCPPVLNNIQRRRVHCRDFNDIAFELIKREKPDIVVLSSVWAIDGSSVDEFLANFRMTVDRLTQLGVRVVILGDHLIYRRPVPLIIADRLKTAPNDMSANGDVVWREVLNEPHKRRLAEESSHRAGVRYISVLKTMCPDYRCPLVTGDEIPVHTDQAHLTEAGSIQFARALAPLILN